MCIYIYFCIELIGLGNNVHFDLHKQLMLGERSSRTTWHSKTLPMANRTLSEKQNTGHTESKKHNNKSGFQNHGKKQFYKGAWRCSKTRIL